MRWTRTEARWRDAVIAAVLPVPDARPAPPEAWALLDHGASPVLRWGFRFAVWWLTWSTLPFHGRLLHRLPPAARDAHLARVAASSAFVPRQVVQVTKLVAALATYREAA